MTVVRSLAYHILFIPWTIALSILYLPLLALAPRHVMQRCAAFWLAGGLFLQRHVIGLSYEIKGIENLPKGPALIAAKHQSAWDTMIFHHLLDSGEVLAVTVGLNTLLHPGCSLLFLASRIRRCLSVGLRRSRPAGGRARGPSSFGGRSGPRSPVS